MRTIRMWALGGFVAFALTPTSLAAQAAPKSVELRPIPAEMKDHYVHLHARLQPSASAWVETQARGELARSAPNIAALDTPMARTLGNVRMFTLAYGAPEQFDDRIGAVGPWTDVYAMALVVLEALMDRPVMVGESMAELAGSALANVRPSPRALGLTFGPRVDDLLGRAVALSPGERPQDAGEFWGMLKNAMSQSEPPGRLDSSRQSSPLPSGPTGPGGTLVMASSGGGPRGAPEGLSSGADGRTASPSAEPGPLGSRDSMEPHLRGGPMVIRNAEGATVTVVRRGARPLVWILLAMMLLALLAVAWGLHVAGRL